MVHDVICLFIQAEIAKRQPLNAEQKKALDAFHEAVKGYDQNVTLQAKRIMTQDRLQAFLQSPNVQQWDAHLQKHVQHIKTLGINFAAFTTRDLQEAFLKTYPAIRSSLK